MIRVTSVEVRPNFHLLLTFSNNQKREFDMNPYLHLPVYQPLQNIGFFGMAHVEYGTVVWPGEIDIAPETLLEFSNLHLPEPLSQSSPSSSLCNQVGLAVFPVP